MTIRSYLTQLKRFPNYTKFIIWVLKNSESFTSTGKLTSAEKRLLIKYRCGTRAKECYYNAQLLSLNSPFQYYEGWCLWEDIGIPLEHGFNVLRGKVVDTTLFDETRKRRRSYFGVHIPTKFVAENMRESGMAEQMLYKYYLKKNPQKTIKKAKQSVIKNG